MPARSGFLDVRAGHARVMKRPATSVTTYPDGPLVVRGDFEICDVDGTPLQTGPIVALCRCGRSGRKPLCDGTHRQPKGRRVRTPDGD